jgi:hypothetical protein
MLMILLTTVLAALYGLAWHAQPANAKETRRFIQQIRLAIAPISEMGGVSLFLHDQQDPCKIPQICHSSVGGFESGRQARTLRDAREVRAAPRIVRFSSVVDLHAPAHSQTEDPAPPSERSNFSTVPVLTM